MFYWDPTMILLLPAVLLSLFAQWKVQATFAKYNEVGLSNGISGAQAAMELARRRRLSVAVEPVAGSLTDHYDPTQNVLRLSEPVYGGRSVAAVGVAAHELGHALQKAQNYPFLMMRTGLVPLVGFSSNLAWIMLPLAFIFHLPKLLWVGIALFSVAVLFSLITLPVEFDASRRALVALREDGLVTGREEAGVRSVLNAAALTYVAAAFMAVLNLLRLVLIARSSDD